MDGPSEPDDVCRNCGERLHPSDNFCPSCGAETNQEPATHTEPAPGRREGTDGGPRNAEPAAATPGSPHREPNGSGGSSPGSPGVLRGRESVLKTLGVAVALVLTAMFVPLIGLAILGFVLFSLGLPETVVLLGLTILQFAWFVAFGLWYLRYRGHDWDSIRSYFGLRMPTLKEYGLILLTWFVILVAAAIVGTILMEVVPDLLGVEQTEPAENSVNRIIENNPEIVLGAIAFMFLVVGPAEEVMFRGVVQNRIRERFSTIPGIVIASILFASVHVLALASTDPVAISMTITVLFVTSLGLGWIYEYTGNLVVPILLHGFHNSVIVAITALGAMSGTGEQAALAAVELLAVLVA